VVRLHRLAQRLLVGLGVCLVDDLARVRASLNALDERLDALETRVGEFDLGVKQ
jgi:hypothetical protein